MVTIYVTEFHYRVVDDNGEQIGGSYNGAGMGNIEGSEKTFSLADSAVRWGHNGEYLVADYDHEALWRARSKAEVEVLCEAVVEDYE